MIDPVNQAIKVISDHLGVPSSEIALDSHLIDDLNTNSLERADLFSVLEQKFKIHIPLEESLKFQTVGDIIVFLKDSFLSVS